ncbi:unnamed protein product [Ectocarpus sp. 12 AP-2014]
MLVFQGIAAATACKTYTKVHDEPDTTICLFSMTTLLLLLHDRQVQGALRACPATVRGPCLRPHLKGRLPHSRPVTSPGTDGIFKLSHTSLQVRVPCLRPVCCRGT